MSPGDAINPGTVNGREAPEASITRYPPRVSVVILNYNNVADTLETLESVFRLRYPSLSVTLVENSTDDRVVETIRAQYPALTIQRNPLNLGYAGGNNAGIRSALGQGADYILLLNNDVLVPEDLVPRLVAEMEEDPACAASQPLITYASQPGRIWSAGTVMSLGYPRLFLKDRLKRPGASFSPQCGLVGCALLIRARALGTIGLLDEELFLMHEETDWCIRARKAGHTLRVIPGTEVRHKVSATIGAATPVYLYFVSRNWLLVARRHFSPAAAAWAVLTEVLIRFPYYAYLLTREGCPSRLRYYLAGIRDGLLGRTGVPAWLGLEGVKP